jgi:hypothetical protein
MTFKPGVKEGDWLSKTALFIMMTKRCPGSAPGEMPEFKRWKKDWRRMMKWF